MNAIQRFISALLLTLSVVALHAQSPAAVVITRVDLEEFPLQVEALGNARANEAVDIRPKIDATVTAVHFEEGQLVAAGDHLVTLENTEPKADVAAARANLLDSESQYQRAQDLFKTKAVPESQLQQLGAQRDAAQAAVAAAEARLAETVIKAPFAGRVGLRRLSVGSLVGSDSIITTLDDTSQVKVDFDVPEMYLARLQPGLPVRARSVAWPEHLFNGEVLSINTRVDPISRTVTVRAAIPNGDLKLLPGMFLTVTLLKQDVNALMIPEQAVIPERSEQFVYVIDDDDHVVQRLIKTGRRRPGQVEVVEGLSPGERIIVEGTQKVRPGDPVVALERAQ